MFGVTKEEYRELTREHFKIEDTLPLSPLQMCIRDSFKIV